MAAMEAQQAMENEDGLEGIATSITADFKNKETFLSSDINILCHFSTSRYC